jgi:hypothetical protein
MGVFIKYLVGVFADEEFQTVFGHRVKEEVGIFPPTKN